MIDKRSQGNKNKGNRKWGILIFSDQVQLGVVVVMLWSILGFTLDAHDLFGIGLSFHLA